MIIFMVIALLTTVAIQGPGDYVVTGSEKPVRVNEMGPNKR